MPVDHVTEWQNFYNDDENSFTYLSMTGLEKEYYGIEAGLDFKVASFLNFKAIGTISDAKNINNANVNYMLSKSAEVKKDYAYIKDMRESGTPLTIGSLALDFHKSGWFVNLNANWYDRIYLSYSPSYRYKSSLKNRDMLFNDEPLPGSVDQAKGHGGWMVDGSIGSARNHLKQSCGC